MSITNNKYLDLLNEDNKHVRKSMPKGNVIVFSEVKEGYFPNVVHEYSIKFPLNGTEHYRINNKEYRVPQMYFLTASGPCDSSGFLESKSLVKGLCVNVSLNLINEALTIYSTEGNINLENNLAGYFKSEKFFENVYPATNSELGLKLLSLSEKFKSISPDHALIDEEIFLELAGSVITLEFENLRKMNSLSSLKTSTKKEILQRLLLGKNFIEDNFKAKIDVKEIAQTSCLSEFHFYRSFKEVFGISPHNYLVKRRLLEAQKLLLQNNSTVGEVAFECGFADIHSFSKSFKKHFGFSPSSQPIKN